MTPATATAPKQPKTNAATTARPGAFAGNLLRVDLTRRTCRAEPWGPERMRAELGGVGLGAMILYRETAAKGGKRNVAWDHPDNRLVLGTGPLAGLPVWGTGGLTVCTIGPGTNGPTSTQANGFFGTNLKYCGYDAIIIQGQSKDWVYLYINDDVVELRDAKTLVGLDTWETQNALYQETGLVGHQLSVYSIGPAGENLVRFAAIQGDFGHVASKNGCGAVMGKKRLKAVAIVKGTKALHAADPHGVMQAADDMAHDLRTDASARSLYEYGTLPGVVNLSKMGALPIKNYTTNLTSNVAGADMSAWEAPQLREHFDHRGHQCNACGMHHCHMSVIRQGPQKGAIVDEPEYEGWSGCGWAIGSADRDGVAWLNTECDRACVDVNEWGWLCGWVMECQEKGYITREQLGFELKWGDIKGAHRQAGRREARWSRQGLCDLHREGSDPARPRPPRAVGRDAGHLHLVHRDDGDGQPRASDGDRAARAGQSLRRRAGRQVRRRAARAAELRRFPRDLHLHVADPAREHLPRPLGGDGLDLHGRGGAPLRAAHRCHQPGDRAPLRPHRRHGISVDPLRFDSGRRSREGPGDPRAMGKDARHLVRRGRFRP